MPSPPGPDGPPPAAPRSGGVTLPIAAAIIVGTVIVLAALVGVAVVATGDRSAGHSGALRTPILIQQVAAADPPPCAAGAVQDLGGTECLRLQGEPLTVRRVTNIRVTDHASGSASAAITVTLSPADAQRFGALSSTAAAQPQGSPGRRLAIIVNGRALTAPEIQEPIVGGTFIISGSFSKPDAERIVHDMTGS